MKTALSIAGNDSVGGAGIGADIKTITLHGVYAMGAVTALTAQNTMGVKAISPVSPEFLAQQIDAVLEDIVPDAVKIGMVPSAVLMEVTARRLTAHRTQNIVIDPIMVATSGSRLMQPEAIDVLKQELLPIAALVTPNLPEAEILADMTIGNQEDMRTAAKKIGDAYGCCVLLKGGHSAYKADDLLYLKGDFRWFRGKRIDTPNTHGTGCTLSSAIAANLAKGFDLEQSVQRAKEYLTGALAARLNLGKGSELLNHAFDCNSRFAAESII